MYAKNIRPGTKHDGRVARLRRVQAFERIDLRVKCGLRMCRFFVFDSYFLLLTHFLSAVHRKLALSVSFCVRKLDFPALVQENFNCEEN